MSYYLISMGGTGARCLEAFIHLAGANLLKDDKTVYVVTVDPDGSNYNLGEADKSIDHYIKANAMSCKAVFRNKIEKLGHYNPVPEGKNTMDEVFNTSLMEVNNKDLDCLYKTLFSFKERKTDLKDGFHGRPSIGAAVIALTMDLEKEPTWKAVMEKISVDDDPRVFMFASVFGGTGASCFPNVAKILKEGVPTNADGESKLKLGGCLMLPYFSFKKATAEVEQSDEAYAKADELIYNTTEALKYYNANKLIGEVFDTIYMVGDHEMPVQDTFSLGGPSQDNKAHFAEVYAALAAFDFFNRESLEGFTHPMVATNSEKISWDDFPNPCVDDELKRKLANYIKFMYSYNRFTMYHLDRVHKDRSNEKSISWYMSLVKKAGSIDIYNDIPAWNRFCDLNKYSDRFFDWLQQIVANKRCEDLINSQVFDREHNIEPYQIVFPITEQKDKLTEKKIFQELGKYDNRNPLSSGEGILLEALYDICGK